MVLIHILTVYVSEKGLFRFEKKTQEKIYIIHYASLWLIYRAAITPVYYYTHCVRCQYITDAQQ